VHRRIIGSARLAKARLLGVAAVVLLGAVLAARPAPAAAADPPTTAARHATLRAVAAEADQALEDLIGQLGVAIDEGRRGSALIQDGDQDPGPSFDEAASATHSAATLANRAAAATTRLDAVLLAVESAGGPLPQGPTSSLAAIAEQLASSGAAGGSFVERRLAATATLTSLGEALEALDDGDPQAALTALDRADGSLATVADWPSPPTVLPLWLETTGAMVEAARGIAQATIAQDQAAAEEAADAYRRAAEEARRADTALALAIAEAGSSLAGTPMRLLAEALVAAIAQREAVQPLLTFGT
jgi:hypothetical protein